MRTMPKAVTAKSKTAAKNDKPAPKKAQVRTKKAAPNTNLTLPSFSREERRRMIETAAYHIAEKDGFKPGREDDYWLQAERQIQDLFPETDAGRSEIH
jgi:hypothetical protein